MDSFKKKIIEEATHSKNAIILSLCSNQELTIMEEISLYSSCVCSKNMNLKSLGIIGYQSLITKVHPKLLFESIGLIIINQPDSIKMDLLKTLLQIGYINISLISMESFQLLFSICITQYNGMLAMAAQATATQICNSYTNYIINKKKGLQNNSDNSITKEKLNHSKNIDTISNIISDELKENERVKEQEEEKLSEYILEKKEEKHTKYQNKDYSNDNYDDGLICLLELLCKNISPQQSSPLLLKCIQACLIPLELSDIDKSFVNFIWQTLGPLLVKLLSFNMSNVKLSSKNMIYDLHNNHGLGRGSEGLDVLYSDSENLKQVYSVAYQLLRLFGSNLSMRPVLEAIYHRMLLYPLIHYRLNALKSIKEIFKSSEMVMKLIFTCSNNQILSSNFNLVKIMIDSLKECSYTNEQEIVLQSIACISTLIQTLEQIINSTEYIQSNNTINISTEIKYDTFNADSFDELESVLDFDSQAQNSFIGTIKGSSSSELSDALDESNDREINNYSKKPTYSFNDRIEQESVNGIKERENSRLFFSTLKQKIPFLLSLKTCFEVDNSLQEIASSFCKEVWDKHRPLDDDHAIIQENLIIINGDGIYLAIYSGVSLTLKLHKINYYSLENIKPPISEKEFIEEIQNSGVLIYLSSTWLAEFYQQILAQDIFQDVDISLLEKEKSAFIKIITDIDGLDCSEPGSKELYDYRKLTNALSVSSTFQSKSSQIVKQFLEKFWNSILTILGSIFRNTDPNQPTLFAFLIDASKDNAEKLNILITCLDSLTIAARLCISLGIQSRCNSIFDLLTRTVLNPYEIGNEKNTNELSPFLHVSQVLSLKSVLTGAIEIASHCNPCWDFVFDCCAFIIEMTNRYFSSQISSNNVKKSLMSILKSSKKDEEPIYVHAGINIDQSTLPGLNTESDVISFLEKCIEEALNEYEKRGIIRDNNFEKCLECLFHLSERIFSDASSRLTLKALLGFLSTLITNSNRKLNSIHDCNKGISFLLFSKFCDVLMKIAKSGRPLIHFMKCWSLSLPHLIDAASCNDHNICKMSISAINDIISTVLSIHTELEYFYFVESLFKPYENLLILELCDIDLQEMVVSSICGFVESFKEDIKSGWRSLFGALRGIRLFESCNEGNYSEMERIRQLRVILDIFEAFLATDNLKIFANAAVDCLYCLLRLTRSEYDNYQMKKSDDEYCDDNSVDLCLLSLKYLHQFESMLRMMYGMPGCPFFTCSRKKVFFKNKIVDIAEGLEIPLEITITLEEIDRPAKILHVWFLLIEGVCDSILQCPKRRQSKTMEVFITLLGTLRCTPGPTFAIYCINHVVLPFLQKWFKEVKNHIVFHFKHFFCLVSHLVVEHLKLGKISGCDLMLSQMLVLLVQTSYQQCELLSNLSLSCLNHIINESWEFLNAHQWDLISIAIDTIHKKNLTLVKQIIVAFPNQTLDFFDDFNNIKVITKRILKYKSNCNLITQELAQDIFLLDSQKDKIVDSEIVRCDNDDDKYSLFQIIVNIQENSSEIFFVDLIHELLNHHFLIRIIGQILLSNASYSLPNIVSLTNYMNQECSMLIATRNHLIEKLYQSYSVFHQFDSRPGLKFLLQKIFKLKFPANLYKQSGLCFSIAFLTNFNILLTSQEDMQAKEKAKNFFEEICEHYTDIIVQTEKDNKLDELYTEPIFLISESGTNLPFEKCRNKQRLKQKLVKVKKTKEKKDFVKEELIKKRVEVQVQADEEDLSESFASAISDNIVIEQEKKKNLIKKENTNNTDSECENISEDDIGHSNREKRQSINDSIFYEKDKDSPYKSLYTSFSNLKTSTLEELYSSDDSSHIEDYKSYYILSEKKIEDMKRDYRKWKLQHSPFPLDFNERMMKKKRLPKRLQSNNELTSEKNNTPSLMKDSEAYLTLWTQIITSIIQLHLSCELVLFNKLVPILEPGIELLIMYAKSKELRSLLTLWIRRCCELIN